jgi:hypothetical protein
MKLQKVKTLFYPSFFKRKEKPAYSRPRVTDEQIQRARERMNETFNK